MGRARQTLSFVNRYLELAGRNCCAGRSWNGLERSLARRAPETQEAPCDDALVETPVDPTEQEPIVREPVLPVAQ